MSKTQFSMSVSNGSNTASVSSDDVSDIVRLMQLSGQPGNNFSLNVSQSQTQQAPDTTVSQSSNFNINTKNPADIMQALRQVVSSAQTDQTGSSVKSCGCASDCECDSSGHMMAESIHKDYPDSEEGAIQALGDMSTHNLQGATAQPDPQVHGVWLVKHPTGQSIVYLKNGSNQPMNDFEDVGESMASLPEDLQIEEEAEFDWGTRDWKDDQHIVSMKRATKQGTAQEPERLSSPRFGSNPLSQEIHERILESWNKWLQEDEKFTNEDGTSSPLSADSRQEFDKDPNAHKDLEITGKLSPMTHIVRQKIPK